MVWALFIRKRDQPHRTHDWHVPFVARRQLGRQLHLLPRVAALHQHARLLRQHLRLPCREDSVISSTLAGSAAEPASIFHFLFFLFTFPNLGVCHGLVAVKAAGLSHPLAVEIFLKQKRLAPYSAATKKNVPPKIPASNLFKGAIQSKIDLCNKILQADYSLKPG